MIAGQLRPRLRVVHRKVLAARARNMTKSTSTRSTLVIAPHPDDEVIGCGATLARKKASGARVKVVVVADGSLGYAPETGIVPVDLAERREHESRIASSRLGLDDDDIVFLRVPDLHAAEDTERIERELVEIASDFAAEEVFSPFGIDNNPDHRAVGAVVERIRRDTLRDANVYAYPVWLWNRWAWTVPERSRRRQDLDLIARPLWHTLTVKARIVETAPYLDRKRHALQAHESQLEILSPDWLSLFLGSTELFFALQEPR